MLCSRKKMFLHGLKCFNTVRDVHVKLTFDRYLSVITLKSSSYTQKSSSYRHVIHHRSKFRNRANIYSNCSN